jgi:hypothetical protein
MLSDAVTYQRASAVPQSARLWLSALGVGDPHPALLARLADGREPTPRAEGHSRAHSLPAAYLLAAYLPSQYVAFTRNTLSGRSASIARVSREKS